MKTIEIGGRAVGPGRPAFIIAELAWAHDGELDKAVRIARGAAKAGADAFSIHVTSLPDYMVRRYGNAGTVSAGNTNSPAPFVSTISISKKRQAHRHHKVIQSFQEAPLLSPAKQTRPP